jgi:hypothetical protein
MSCSNRAVCRLRLGKPEEALQDADKAISIDALYVKGCASPTIKLLFVFCGKE